MKCNANRSRFLESLGDCSNLSEADINFLYEHRAGYGISSLAAHLSLLVDDDLFQPLRQAEEAEGVRISTQQVAQVIRASKKPRPRRISPVETDEPVITPQLAAEEAKAPEEPGRDFQSILRDMLGERSLPEPVIAFLKAHTEGSLVTDLARATGMVLGTAKALAKREKIKARKVPSPRSFNPGQGEWFADLREAVRVCDVLFNWVDFGQATLLLKEAGVETSVDTLREYVSLGLILPSGLDLAERAVTILRESIPTLAEELPAIMHKKRVHAAKRCWEKKDGELDTDDAHAVLDLLPYKTLLTLFARNMIVARKKGGHWYTTLEKIDVFLGRVADGAYRKDKEQRLTPQNIAICLRLYKQRSAL